VPATFLYLRLICMTTDTIPPINSNDPRKHLEISIDQFKLAKVKLDFCYDCFYKSTRGYAEREIARRLLYRLGLAQRYLPILESRRNTILNDMRRSIPGSDDYQQLLNRLNQAVEETNIYTGFLRGICSDPIQVLRYPDVQEMDLMSQSEWLSIVEV
jgi:hypothetical protein